MEKAVLPRFQEYLTRSNLVQEKKASYYAYWASKFLYFAKHYSELTRELKIQKFVDSLKHNNVYQDWQISQAEDSISSIY